MSSSMIPSLNPEEHLDRASKTNTHIHKEVPTCTHKHQFLMAEACVGHTSPLRLGAVCFQHPCTTEGISACTIIRGRGDKRHPVKVVGNQVQFLFLS